MTAPTAKPIAAFPRSVPAATRTAMGASSASVAMSNLSRLRRRSSATKGLRQITRRSPGGILGGGDLWRVLLLGQRERQGTLCRELLHLLRFEGSVALPGQVKQ
ncbi:MAG: hypothetical protein ACYDHD_05450 [Vulcanimicrobiaceae bacterium]